MSSSENIKFSFNNTEKAQPQKQISKEDKTPAESSSPAPVSATSQFDNKAPVFGNFNGTSSTSIFGSTTPINNSTGSIFGASATIKASNNTAGGFSFPGFGIPTGPTTPATGFQFSTPAAPSTATATTTANTPSTFSFGATGSQPLFGNSPKFSFSDVAKQTSSNDKSTSNGTEQRGMNIHFSFF